MPAVGARMRPMPRTLDGVIIARRAGRSKAGEARGRQEKLLSLRLEISLFAGGAFFEPRVLRFVGERRVAFVRPLDNLFVSKRKVGCDEWAKYVVEAAIDCRFLKLIHRALPAAGIVKLNRDGHELRARQDDLDFLEICRVVLEARVRLKPDLFFWIWRLDLANPIAVLQFCCFGAEHKRQRSVGNGGALEFLGQRLFDQLLIFVPKLEHGLAVAHPVLELVRREFLQFPFGGIALFGGCLDHGVFGLYNFE